MRGTRIAIIPARGGSKRIPRKNIRLLGGKPMLAYTVEAALQSDCFDRVIVSTDDAEVAEAAMAAGADVPILRSAEIADDQTPVSTVTIDMLERLAAQGHAFETVAQLLPNCPLRDADDVRASLAAFTSAEGGFQISVSAFGWLNPWWAMRLDQAGRVEAVFPEALKARSQDLHALYCPNGSIWWAQVDALVRARTFYGPGLRGFPLKWQHAVDIDEEADFEMAELLLAGRRGH